MILWQLLRSVTPTSGEGVSNHVGFVTLQTATSPSLLRHSSALVATMGGSDSFEDIDTFPLRGPHV